MLEILLVAAVLGAIGSLGALVVWVPWTWTFGVGLGLLTLGFAAGLPAGIWYHVVLRRAVLAAELPLPARWWLRPTELHHRLDEDQLEPVLPSFFAGAAGFVGMILGCALVVTGLARSPYL